MSTQSTSLSEELSAIEAVVSEYEEKIKDGRHSVENLQKQIEAVADANVVMAKMNAGDNEWLDKWKKETMQLSGIDKINILRLSELKFQYPNESRIFKLGDRAVKCFLKLCEINCTVVERQFTPDLRPQIEASNREIMAGLRKMYSNMFTDSTFVPSSQSHFADAFGATAKQKIEDIRRNTKAKNNSSSSDNIQLISKKGLFITIFIALGAIGAALALYFLPTQANISESDNNPMPEIEIYKSFTDPRDNKTYKTVKIGNQTWIAQNLNYNAQGSKCYGNDESNCQIYGRLYNWSAATKACPSGWHLPSNSEWDILYRSVDGTSGTESPYKSETAGKYLKAKNGWNEGGNGTDNYGFAALPGGLGNSSGGFSSLGNYGNWWSSSESDGSKSYNHFKSYKHNNAGWETEAKNKLFSVRCVMDYETSVKSFTDTRDNKTYKAVTIGNQTWMAENLKYEVEGSKCYNHNPENCQKYGRLYNWEPALKACPSGWHLPKDYEWAALADYVGSDARRKLKSKSGWDEGGNGTDEYGFSALPSGTGKSDGSFVMLGKYGYWWSIGEGTDAYYRYISSENNNLNRLNSTKKGLFPIRCIQN